MKKKIIRRFSSKIGDRIEIVPEEKIFYFYAQEKYVFLVTKSDEFIINFTLKELLKKLDLQKFCQVNRSHIIQLNYVSSVRLWFGGRLKIKMKDGKEIIVSRKYVKEFKEKVNL